MTAPPPPLFSRANGKRDGPPNILRPMLPVSSRTLSIVAQEPLLVCPGAQMVTLTKGLFILGRGKVVVFGLTSIVTTLLLAGPARAGAVGTRIMATRPANSLIGLIWFTPCSHYPNRGTASQMLMTGILPQCLRLDRR